MASIIVKFDSAKGHQSQREFAKDNGIPRSTLQHWLERKASIDATPELIEFFESPCGIAFLHRMITAAHFEFCKKGPASIHNVSNFLKACGLQPFVGTSYSTQRLVADTMDQSIILFGETERERLTPTMREKWITLCEDETFHPAICSVSIEPVSNFILLEEYVENRSAQTWNEITGKALEGLPVKVIQITSDEARGLINHAQKGLGAHHSSDVFHVQQEIGRGTTGALNGAIKKTVKRKEATSKKVEGEQQAKDKYDNLPKRPRGRRPGFEIRIEAAVEKDQQADKNLETARQNQESVQQARRNIGHSYHPYDLETGKIQNPEKVAELLESSFNEIDSAITTLPDRCKKRVEKAHRVVGSMVSSISFFIMISQYMDNMNMSEHQRKIMNEKLIPGFYLLKAAQKEKDEMRRNRILEKSSELLLVLSDSNGPLSGYTEKEIRQLEEAAQDCADIFQRSSSCVEGRNAQLSLRHHGIHRLSPQHLKALTVVHNFSIKNRDGTTAAERFFEAKHYDLFEWLLDNMDYPARPRKRLANAA